MGLLSSLVATYANILRVRQFNTSIFNAREYATGGTGTLASPYTGWTAGITAAQNAGGGVLFVPGGYYAVTSMIQFPNNVILDCSHNNNTTIFIAQAALGANPMFNLQTQGRFYGKNCVIDGNRIASYGIYGQGNGGDPFSGGFSRVVVQNCLTTGYFLGQVNEFILDHCEARQCRRGIHLADNIGTTVIGGAWQFNWENNIRVTGSRNWGNTFISPYLEGNVESCTPIFISNNGSQNRGEIIGGWSGSANAAGGIYIEGDATTDCRGWKIGTLVAATGDGASSSFLILRNYSTTAFVNGETITDGGTGATATINASPGVLSGATRLSLAVIVGQFREGDTVTGGTSGATGIVAPHAITQPMVLDRVRGTFQIAETIQGGTSGASAVVSAINGTSLTLTGIRGFFQSGETITGLTSIADGILLPKRGYLLASTTQGNEITRRRSEAYVDLGRNSFFGTGAGDEETWLKDRRVYIG